MDPRRGFGSGPGTSAARVLCILRQIRTKDNLSRSVLRCVFWYRGPRGSGNTVNFFQSPGEMCRTTYLSVLILCLSHVVNCERSPVVDRSHSLRLRGGSAVGSSYAPTGGAGAPVSNPSASTSAAQDKPPVTAAPQSYAPKAVQSYERPTESSYGRPAAQSYERPAAQSYAPPQSYSKQIYATESAAEAPRPATPRPATPEPASAEQLVGKVESITDGGAGKVTELAQKNRLLLQQCLVGTPALCFARSQLLSRPLVGIESDPTAPVVILCREFTWTGDPMRFQTLTEGGTVVGAERAGPRGLGHYGQDRRTNPRP